jgi:hypothetical protein
MTDPLTPNQIPPPVAKPDPSKAAADAKTASDKAAADKAASDKVAFEAKQKSEAAAFEAQQKAAATKMEQDKATAQADLDAKAKLAKAESDNCDAAFKAGLITHHDLLSRGDFVTKYPGCLLPHQVLAPGEATVKMAFPKTVVLTRSASDIFPDQDEPAPIYHGSQVLFRKGYEDVPESLADHQYLFDSGAYRVGGDGKPETVEARNARLKTAADKKAAAKKKTP